MSERLYYIELWLAGAGGRFRKHKGGSVEQHMPYSTCGTAHRLNYEEMRRLLDPVSVLATNALGLSRMDCVPKYFHSCKLEGMVVR